MNPRRFFQSADYSAFCEKIAPFEIIDDMTKSVRNSSDLQSVRLAPMFWDKANLSRSQRNISIRHVKIENINDLQASSFIVGESHRQISPKRFLIENMRTLKEAGFTTLYLEHLYYDNQKLLDEYYETGSMDANLKSQLTKLDSDHYVPDSITLPYDEFEIIKDEKVRSFHFNQWKQFNFATLVETAQREGIRVVAIDIKAVYESQRLSNSISSLYTDNKQEIIKRISAMNYIAQAIINREQKNNNNSKWISLMGNLHVSRQHNIPGVSDIFNVPALYVFDKEYLDEAIVNYDTKLSVDNYAFPCDVLIQSSLTSDLSLNALASKIEKKI